MPNAISEFLHDEFALSADTPTVMDENGCEEDVSGMYFSQLPEWALFSGHPSKSSEYNHTVSAGSAKPTSVQARRDAMWSLLPAVEATGGFAPEEVASGDVEGSEQFEEEGYIGCWAVDSEK